jgi:death-on-curing family protein
MSDDTLFPENEIVNKEIVYIKSADAIEQHLVLMKSFNENRCGLRSLEMLESALARPQNAAVYENADFIRQIATLYFGLVKNRIWHGGNKRTATTLIKTFIEKNSFQTNWKLEEIMELGRNVDIDAWKVDEIEDWLKNRAVKL